MRFSLIHLFRIAKPTLGLMLVGAVVICCGSPAIAVTDKQVETAIEKFKFYFWENQHEDGHWETGPYATRLHNGGTTALVVYALLASGESYQQPRLRKAIDYLKKLEVSGTYATSCRAHVWASLPDSFRDHLTADVARLKTYQGRGWFGYDSANQGNMSTSHFGVLGIWAGAKRGVQDRASFWRAVQSTHLRLQKESGGFAYNLTGSPTGSMTAAGLTMLLISREQLDQRRRRPSPELNEAINLSLDWFDHHYIGAENPGASGNWRYYYLYALERIGLACGRKHFAHRDWFVDGVEHILANQLQWSAGRSKAGSMEDNLVSSAFCLLFLARGRVPVWASKLHIPLCETDNCPNDLLMLSRQISSSAEKQFNYQRLDLTKWLKPDDIGTPVAMLASHEAISLNAAQRDILRQYILQGGTLVASPDGGSPAFSKSILRLGEDMFPEYQFREMEEDHPLFHCLYKISERMTQKVYTLSNGARDLIILAERDWSYQWQAQTATDATSAGKLPLNLWMLLTNGGDLPPRLRPVVQQHTYVEPDNFIVIARGQYQGYWRAEPMGWWTVSRQLYRLGTQLSVTEQPLDQLSDDIPLVHVSGTLPADIPESQLDGIIGYARNGGTVLIETVGGRGGFARHLMRDMEKRIGYGASRIASDHPIITGEGLQHGADNQRVRFTRHTVARMSLQPRPRLAAFHIEGRPAIIVSDEDLTLGAMAVNRWGILGYHGESARPLMMNIVLWAQQYMDQREAHWRDLEPTE